MVPRADVVQLESGNSIRRDLFLTRNAGMDIRSQLCLSHDGTRSRLMKCIFYMIIGAALVLGFQEHYAVTEFAKEVLATGATWVLAMTNDSTVVIY